jgi:hypothetical protein
MRKNTLTKLIYGIAFLAFFASCKAKRVLLPTAGIPKVMDILPANDLEKETKISAIKLMNIEFNSLSIKAKANLTIDNKSNEVSMNIRIRNNEVIWASVTAIAGLEVARLLISPDSVKIINRLDNIYIQKPFSYLYEFTNDRISFQTLQSLLIGNVMNEFLTEDTEVKKEGDDAFLETILSPLTYSLKVDDKNKAVFTALSDENADQELLVNYANFMMVNQYSVPHLINMSSKANAKAMVFELSYLKIDRNTKFDLPFRVPERFMINN